MQIQRLPAMNEAAPEDEVGSVNELLNSICA
jgi:hypothetical protein